MDAITSFQHIVDNLPLWKEQVTKLVQHTSQRHEEFRAEYVRLLTTKPKPSRRIKSPSISSIHTNDDTEQQDVEMQQDGTVESPNPVDINPLEAGNRFIYAQANKKRKPGTSFRSGASGPSKFRNRQAVVIWYDGYVQEQLEGLVKSLGASRNNLRKGKMAYTVAKGLQLPVLGRKFETSPPASALEGIRSAKLPAMKSEILLSTQDVPAGEAAFKQADKDLETCQTLCETAAHQFLRDGDCKLELDTVLKNLDMVSELSSAALDSLKAEEHASTENDSSAGSFHTESDATLVEKSSREMLKFHTKLSPQLDSTFNTRPSLPTVNSAPPATTEIEVDDDDSESESIQIDISNFRSTRARIRS